MVVDFVVTHIMYIHAQPVPSVVHIKISVCVLLNKLVYITFENLQIHQTLSYHSYRGFIGKMVLQARCNKFYGRFLGR